MNDVNLSVMAQRGKISWQLEYQKVTPYNKPHTKDLLGKTQGGGCLCREAAGKCAGDRLI